LSIPASGGRAGDKPDPIGFQDDHGLKKNTRDGIIYEDCLCAVGSNIPHCLMAAA